MKEVLTNRENPLYSAQIKYIHVLAGWTKFDTF